MYFSFVEMITNDTGKLTIKDEVNGKHEMVMEDAEGNEMSLWINKTEVTQIEAGMKMAYEPEFQ